MVALCGLAAAYVAKGGLESRFAVGQAADSGNPVVLAFLAAIAVGMAAGALQGWAITRLKVPPFVVTLGGLTAWRGAALLLSGGGPISGFGPDYTWWGQGRIEGVPVPVIIFVLAAVVAHVVLRHTRFGLHVHAVGGNDAAATLNGVHTRRVVFLVYVIVGFFCGLASLLLSARLNSAEAVAGLGLELDVIAAVVIGGTSLMGGSGGAIGSLIGALVIRAISFNFRIFDVAPLLQPLIEGLVLLAAVSLGAGRTFRVKNRLELLG
jgi:inositol transport system permease protein